MIRIDTFANRTVAVLGLGRSGLASARALAAGGARVAAWDDSEMARETAAVEGIPIVDLSDAQWTGIEALIISPGIPHTHPRPHPAAVAARAAGTPVIGDIELLSRSRADAGFVGITGTNGKSTTTALLGHILANAGLTVQVGGNLGQPVLGMEPLNAAGVYVLEMSSYQLELTPSRPFDVAVLINISPDHLDRHGGMDGYVAAKRMIFGKSGATAVVGIDDAWSRAICDEQSGQGRTIPISANGRARGGVYVLEGALTDELEGGPVTVTDLTAMPALPGRHNWQNAAAVYAAARSLGVEREKIVEGMKTFPGLVHRQERVDTIDGVAFINDSKATNADAAARALVCYERIHWIIGGRAKEGGLADAEPYLDRVAKAYLIGEAAAPFALWLKDRLPFETSGDLATAVKRAFANARNEPGSTVLLSPACASFDQFRDFEARGDAFKSLVSGLREEVSR